MIIVAETKPANDSDHTERPPERDFGKPEVIHTLETLPPPEDTDRVDGVLPPIPERETQPDGEDDDINGDVIRHGLAHLVTTGALEDLSRAASLPGRNSGLRSGFIDEVVNVLRGGGI